MGSDLITHLTTDSFDAAIKETPPVLVDFWAEWCGPCKAMAPTLDEIAAEFEGKLRIAKVDVDANQEIADRFEIKGIPALLLFEDGELLARIAGVRPKAQLLETIEPLL